MRRRRPFAAAAAVALLALAGCAAALDDTPADGVDSSSGAASDLAEVEAFVRTPGPLEEILTAIAPNLVPFEGSRAERDAHVSQLFRTADAYIAACMQEQGFEYLINEDPLIDRERAVRDDLEPGTYAFVREFAFSVSNPAWYMETTGSDADPNAELLAAMSDAHREAWGLALHGDWNDPHSFGCRDAGTHVFAGPAIAPDDEFFGLWNEITAFFSWLGNTHSHGGNPVEDEWSACMVAAGHEPHHNPTALRHAFEERWGGVDHSDDDAVRDFATREFAAAADGFRCEVDVDLHRRSEEWRHEQEAQFVEQHRGELDAWKARDAA